MPTTRSRSRATKESDVKEAVEDIEDYLKKLGVRLEEAFKGVDEEFEELYDHYNTLADSHRVLWDWHKRHCDAHKTDLGLIGDEFDETFWEFICGFYSSLFWLFRDFVRFVLALCPLFLGVGAIVFLFENGYV